MTTRLSIVLALCFVLSIPPAHAASVTLISIKDNTLYEDGDGLISNGSGPVMFVGKTFQGQIRRPLLAFDVAGNVPATATITSARLTLTMSKTRAPAFPVGLRRVLADWGEGSSLALGEGGSGTSAAFGDATWIHRSFNTAFWTNPGGDFDAVTSATVNVGGVGAYTWGSTPQMVADVQSWLNSPATNFGWLLLGNEAVSPGNSSTKRFGTRENATPANRPTLVIEYDVLTPVHTETWGSIKALYH